MNRDQLEDCRFEWRDINTYYEIKSRRKDKQNHTNKRGGLFVENAARQQVKIILHTVHHHCVSRVIPSLITHSCYKHERKYRDKLQI